MNEEAQKAIQELIDRFYESGMFSEEELRDDIERVHEMGVEYGRELERNLET